MYYHVFILLYYINVLRVLILLKKNSVEQIHFFFLISFFLAWPLNLHQSYYGTVTLICNQQIYCFTPHPTHLLKHVAIRPNQTLKELDSQLSVAALLLLTDGYNEC